MNDKDYRELVEALASIRPPGTVSQEAGSAESTDGYERRENPGWCKYCDERVYWLFLKGRGWRPIESWLEGNAAEGEWIYHDCQNY